MTIVQLKLMQGMIWRLQVKSHSIQTCTRGTCTYV